MRYSPNFIYYMNVIDLYVKKSVGKYTIPTRWAPISYKWTQKALKINGRKYILGGGLKHFLFSPLFGEDSQFD